MKSSTYLSLGLLVAVILWMLSGAIASVPEQDSAANGTAVIVPMMKVKVLEMVAEEITREIVVQGELEPLRQVEIRAQTTSRVIALPARKGERVKAGMPVVELAVEDREAQYQRAQAEMHRQRFELAGARKLQQQGLQSETLLKTSEAALAAAEAELKRAALELEYINLRAPFDSVLEERYVELGSHLETGDRVALLVDDSVLKAVGRISQQSAGELSLGQPIRVRLLDGREAQGRVTYVSRLGDAETHSFRVEAEVANADGRLHAGVSAELRIAIGKETAHFLSPAVLSLNDQGDVGVKSVSSAGRVRFHPITLVRTEAHGVWVTGLPRQVRLITQGQGFVNAGEAVISGSGS